MSGRIHRTDSAGFVTLTLSRPEKLNALDTATFLELETHVSDLATGRPGDVRCVVLRGAGRSFCAGADLGSAGTAAAETAIWKSHVLRRLAALPMPVVAVVHGHCIGGGIELALCADLVVATDDAVFRDAHGRHDLVPAWGLTQRLPRRIGRSATAFMAFTGRPVPAAQAHAWGLVDVLVPGEALDPHVDDLVSDIVASSWFTSAEVKRLLRETDGVAIEHGLAQEHYRHPRRLADPPTTQTPGGTP